MLPKSWVSNRLSFATFDAGGSAVAKEIYDSCAYLRDLDPHFGDYPLEEFEAYIRNDQTGAAREGTPNFYLRCIYHLETSTPVGYVQFELDAPAYRQCWLPMFLLRPEFHGDGYGAEALQSLLHEIDKIGDVDTVGLNVYAENVRAFRFWFRCGWRTILGVDEESVNGKQYTCVTLSRNLD